MSRDLTKTMTYLTIHLTVGFSVAYWFTGSLALAGGIALIEPCINAIAFFFHEKAWKRVDAGALRLSPLGAGSDGVSFPLPAAI